MQKNYLIQTLEFSLWITFTKKHKKMELRSSGMEFATEMIAKATLLNLKITEVPTTLSVSISPRTPHLKPFRDGLRHLNLMMTYSFIKLFNKSFNVLLSLTIPLYLITLIFAPFNWEILNYHLVL